MKQQTPSISFEFFPPKTTEGVATLHASALELAKLHPNFFSVTFGAGGSTREGTLETAKLIQHQTGIPVAPHLACIGATRYEICDVLKTYQALGVKKIVALRGDLPSGMVQSGELQYAYDLVKLIRQETGDDFEIEVAAYPEIHPQAKNAEADVLNLKRKFQAGANGAITQYFFNPDSYFYFLDECAKHQINMPITPGIMPITQFTRLVRFSNVCGAEIPRWLYKRLESYGDDTDSIQSFGLEVIHHLCERLIQGGAPGLHFYTLNRAEASISLVRSLGLEQVTNIVTKPVRA